jgi:hypothetical protein
MRPGFVFLMNAMLLSFLVIIYLFGLAYDLCGLCFFNDNSSDVLMDYVFDFAIILLSLLSNRNLVGFIIWC